MQRYDALAAKVVTRLLAANTVALDWAAEHGARDAQRVPGERAQHATRLRGLLSRTEHGVAVAADKLAEVSMAEVECKNMLAAA